MKRFLALLTAAACLASAGASPAATLSDVIIHGKAADAIQEKNELSAVWAEKIAKHCVDEAASHNLPVAVTIIDQFGEVIYHYRADGMFGYAVGSALLKAKTALNTHAPSKAGQNAVYSGTTSETRQFAAGNFPQAGGLPIVVDNQLLGAIGAGGMPSTPPSWSDEICAHNALTAVLGPQPPLLPDVPRPMPGH